MNNHSKSNRNVGTGPPTQSVLKSLTPPGKHNGRKQSKQKCILVRTMVESKASKNVLRKFYLLGYELYHELLRGVLLSFAKGRTNNRYSFFV
ncbi:hypothetical protein HanPSC8_Chr16g0742211 [Helianthus annuus]|nr:hypothetical protein HanIR_Chr16g0839801 [Helianthus annuus]KAJ0823305.1 hypothetical protein HanPSC8_Chr16g0742211 [Helianthus annuus]